MKQNFSCFMIFRGCLPFGLPSPGIIILSLGGPVAPGCDNLETKKAAVASSCDNLGRKKPAKKLEDT